MLPDEPHNPGSAVIGLDVDAVKGKSITEVRRVVNRRDCALVVATEDAPPALPAKPARRCRGNPEKRNSRYAGSWLAKSPRAANKG